MTDIIITAVDLGKAISHKIGGSLEETIKNSYDVKDYLGEHKRRLDNYLDTDLRQLFYQLEDHGLVYREHEPATTSSGRMLDLYFWGLNISNILEAKKNYERSISKKVIVSLPENKTSENEDKKLEHLYNGISNDTWFHREVPETGFDFID